MKLQHKIALQNNMINWLLQLTIKKLIPIKAIKSLKSWVVDVVFFCLTCILWVDQINDYFVEKKIVLQH